MLPLEDLLEQTLQRIDSAQDADALEAVRVEVLGRKGTLAQLSKTMAQLSAEERSSMGKMLNATKQTLEAALDARKAKFDSEALAKRLDAEWVDLTLPAPGPRPGSLHPITQIQSEIEELFLSLGFTVLDGPEVETEYNNFDALN